MRPGKEFSTMVEEMPLEQMRELAQMVVAQDDQDEEKTGLHSMLFQFVLTAQAHGMTCAETRKLIDDAWNAL